MTYGYARISTKQQSIERQIRNISAAFPDARIYREAYTGTKIERPEFEKLLKRLKSGDTVVFDSVSRMSRDAEDGFALYQDLYNKGINLVFLKEHHIDTDTYKSALTNQLAMTGDDTDLILQGVNAYLLRLAAKQIRLAFEQAQKEVDDLHQRTKEGIQTAKLKGKQIGQKQGAKLNVKKAAPAKAAILQHSKDFGGTLDDKDCMKLAGVSRNTYFKYKRELKEEQ
jgi:DNA invertase Pin-like site-specific DNA recombinase